MQHLLDEAARMPPTGVRFVRGVSQVRTIEHLVPLRRRVRTQHAGALRQLHAAIDRRFGATGASDDYVNVFDAASAMALMERIGRDELFAEDRRMRRRLSEDLFAA